MPKFAHVQDANVNKFRGKACIEATCLLYPRVIGVKGRFGLEVFETPLGIANDLSVKHAPGGTTPLPGAAADKPAAKKATKEEAGAINLYKTIGTSLGIELILEKPLLNRKRLKPVEKSVRDFVPRRVIPDHLMFEKRSKKAQSDYHEQIKEIVRKLVLEYQGVLEKIIAQSAGEGVSSNGMFSRAEGGDGESIDTLLPLPFVPAGSMQEEQQRKKNFMFHLNKSGAYFFFKEQLKSSVVEVVREVCYLYFYRVEIQKKEFIRWKAGTSTVLERNLCVLD
jgi:hypothetical protein